MSRVVGVAECQNNMFVFPTTHLSYALYTHGSTLTEDLYVTVQDIVSLSLKGCYGINEMCLWKL